MVVHAGCKRCWMRRAASGLCCACSNLVTNAIVGPDLRRVMVTIRFADTIRIVNTINNKRKMVTDPGLVMGLISSWGSKMWSQIRTRQVDSVN